MYNNEKLAVLWDMDGVIADTAPYHFPSWQIAFKPEGIEVTEEQFRQAFGMNNRGIIPLFFGRDVDSVKFNAVADLKERTFRQLVKGHIRAYPGVIELIESVQQARFKMALVSSTPIENINLITETMGIKKYFSVILSGEDVTAGKPDPQGYLMAAKKLSVKSNDCLVIEDAAVGVEAAKRGGMKCIAVTNTLPAAQLARADLIVDSLKSVNVEIIVKLINKQP